MYLWQISLLLIVLMLPIGIALKYITDTATGNVLSWSQHGKSIINYVKKTNRILWLLIIIDGIVENSAFLVFLISIPLFIILHI